MAQVIIDSAEMRDSANTLSKAAADILDLFQQMMQLVDQMSSKMKGKTIEEQREQFSEMQDEFQGFSDDIQSYSDFLVQAAEQFEAVEEEGTTHAQDQGKIF